MNVLSQPGLATQIGCIKEYVNQQILSSRTDITVAGAIADGDGNVIKTTYVPVSKLGNMANKVPVFTDDGHLVLPSGIEIY